MSDTPSPAKRKYVKFLGKFKDLIPEGWKFHKLFANNYRSYSIEPTGEKHTGCLWIWQHLGGYLEVEDLHGHSATLVEHIALHGPESLASRVEDVFQRGTMITVFWLRLDRKQEEFYPYHSEEAREIRNKYYACKSPEEVREYGDRYREVLLSSATIYMLHDMLKRGIIEVREDTRKKR